MLTIKIGDKVLVNKKYEGTIANIYDFSNAPSVYIVDLDNGTRVKASAEFLEPIVSEKTITRRQYQDKATEIMNEFGDTSFDILYNLECLLFND